MHRCSPSASLAPLPAAVQAASDLGLQGQQWGLQVSGPGAQCEVWPGSLPATQRCWPWCPPLWRPSHQHCLVHVPFVLGGEGFPEALTPAPPPPPPCFQNPGHSHLFILLELAEQFRWPQVLCWVPGTAVSRVAQSCLGPWRLPGGPLIPW